MTFYPDADSARRDAAYALYHRGYCNETYRAVHKLVALPVVGHEGITEIMNLLTDAALERCGHPDYSLRKSFDKLMAALIAHNLTTSEIRTAVSKHMACFDTYLLTEAGKRVVELEMTERAAVDEAIADEKGDDFDYSNNDGFGYSDDDDEDDDHDGEGAEYWTPAYDEESHQQAIEDILSGRIPQQVGHFTTDEDGVPSYIPERMRDWYILMRLNKPSGEIPL